MKDKRYSLFAGILLIGIVVGVANSDSILPGQIMNAVATGRTITLTAYVAKDGKDASGVTVIFWLEGVGLQEAVTDVDGIAKAVFAGVYDSGDDGIEDGVLKASASVGTNTVSWEIGPGQVGAPAANFKLASSTRSPSPTPALSAPVPNPSATPG